MTLSWVMSNQAASDSGHKIIVYAKAGMGKTMLAATLPQPMIISNEAGLKSLTKRNIELIFGAGRADISYDIPVLQTQTLEDLEGALNFARSKEADQFKSICLDSCSEMAEVMLAKFKLGTKDPRMAYGDMATKMTDVVRQFRDLVGKNVYLVCKESFEKDEVTGASMFGPSFPGRQLLQSIPYLFDEMWQLSMGRDAQGKSYRFLRTQPDFQNSAKNRSGGLAEIEFPHLGSLINKMNGATQ